MAWCRLLYRWLLPLRRGRNLVAFHLLGQLPCPRSLQPPRNHWKKKARPLLSFSLSSSWLGTRWTKRRMASARRSWTTRGFLPTLLQTKRLTRPRRTRLVRTCWAHHNHRESPAAVAMMPTGRTVIQELCACMAPPVRGEVWPMTTRTGLAWTTAPLRKQRLRQQRTARAQWGCLRRCRSHCNSSCRPRLSLTRRSWQCRRRTCRLPLLGAALWGRHHFRHPDSWLLDWVRVLPCKALIRLLLLPRTCLPLPGRPRRRRQRGRPCCCLVKSLLRRPWTIDAA